MSTPCHDHVSISNTGRNIVYNLLAKNCPFSVPYYVLALRIFCLSIQVTFSYWVPLEQKSVSVN